MFPIDILPGVARQIVDMLPIPYMAYFPVAVFLGKITGRDLIVGPGRAGRWVVFFMVASRMTLCAGFKRYSGYGG